MRTELPATVEEIALIIGPDMALALCEYYAGATLHIPSLKGLQRATRNNAIKALAEKSVPVATIGERYNLSPRHVRRILEDQ